MGVTASVDGVTLLYNPEFVEQVTLDELGGVLLHGVYHVLFGHILADPADCPDRWARLVAEETAANEFILEPLPGNPIRLDWFPELPPMESTERRYRRLKPYHPRFPVCTTTGAILAGRRGRGKQSAEVIDDHSIWREAREHGDDVEAAIRRAMQDEGKSRDESRGSAVRMSIQEPLAAADGQEEQDDVEAKTGARKGGHDKQDDAEATGDQETQKRKPENGNDAAKFADQVEHDLGEPLHSQSSFGSGCVRHGKGTPPSPATNGARRVRRRSTLLGLRRLHGPTLHRGRRDADRSP